MKYVFLFVVSVILLGTSSCERKCTLSGVIVYFNGFDSSELSTIVVRQYHKGGNFSVANSITVYVSDSSALRTCPDTVYVKNPYGTYVPIDPNYDYIVSLPATTGSYTITSISVGHEKTGDMDASHTYACSLSWHLNNRAQSDGSNISGSDSQAIDINKN